MSRGGFRQGAGRKKEYTEPVKKILLGLPESVLEELDQFAEKRKLSDINLEEVSQGGVFTGRKAKKLGLVDLIGGEREAIKYLEEKVDTVGLPLVDWTSSTTSSSLFDLIFRQGDISNLGKNFLSNSGFRLYSILF